MAVPSEDRSLQEIKDEEKRSAIHAYKNTLTFSKFDKEEMNMKMLDDIPQRLSALKKKNKISSSSDRQYRSVTILTEPQNLTVPNDRMQTALSPDVDN